jgi:hypothetical protein
MPSNEGDGIFTAEAQRRRGAQRGTGETVQRRDAEGKERRRAGTRERDGGLERD